MLPFSVCLSTRSSKVQKNRYIRYSRSTMDSPAATSRGPQPPGWTPVKSPSESGARSPRVQPTPSPTDHKRERSPLGALGPNTLAPGLAQASAQGVDMVETPGGTLQTPGGGRNPIRRRLRSPAMMSSPFKSSVQFGGTPLKSARKPLRSQATPLKSPMEESVLAEAVSSMFVSPGGSSARGSPMLLPSKAFASPASAAKSSPGVVGTKSPWGVYNAQSPGSLRWADVRRPSVESVAACDSPYLGSPFPTVIEEETNPAGAECSDDGESDCDEADASLLRAMAEAEDSFVGPRQSTVMQQADQEPEEEEVGTSQMDSSAGAAETSGLELVDLDEAEDKETELSAVAEPEAHPDRKPKPAERPGWEVVWSKSQEEWCAFLICSPVQHGGLSDPLLSGTGGTPRHASRRGRTRPSTSSCRGRWCCGRTAAPRWW